MKINNLKINGFGKLENKEIKLEKNINLIYGENEAGKTTLLKFISGIFYGISKNKNKKEFPDFERYNPWKGNEFSGKINYNLDNNETFEVFREFNKKTPKIYKNGEEITKNFNIDKLKGNQFFYEQTGIDETTFLSTTLIEQKEVVLDSNDQNVLIQKIANLLSTGEENVSYKKTINALNKKQVEEVGTARTVGRPLNLIEKKIEEYTKAKEKIGDIEYKKEELKKRQQVLKNQLSEKEIKTKIVQKTIQNKAAEEVQKEKIKINEDIIEDEKNKILNLKNKINSEKIEKNKINYLFFYIFFIILFLINLFIIILQKNNLIKIIFNFITILFFGIFIIKKININKKNKIKKENQKKYLLEIKNSENNIEKISENIKKIKLEINNKINLENNIIKNEFKNMIDDDEFNYFFNENINSLNNIKQELDENISLIKLELHTVQIDYNNVQQQLEEKAKIEENLRNFMEEKWKILELNKSIDIAKEAIERAYERMKNEITPKFTNQLSNIVKEISSNKYKNVKFIDGQGLIVELENGEYISANKLSIGTIDQLYLSLRLSAMQEITEEKMPIILDEAFAYYDNERLENILKYLEKNCKENQIIIFTCSNREKEIFEKNNINFNYIKLHN